MRSMMAALPLLVLLTQSCGGGGGGGGTPEPETVANSCSDTMGAQSAPVIEVGITDLDYGAFPNSASIPAFDASRMEFSSKSVYMMDESDPSYIQVIRKSDFCIIDRFESTAAGGPAMYWGPGNVLNIDSGSVGIYRYHIDEKGVDSAICLKSLASCVMEVDGSLLGDSACIDSSLSSASRSSIEGAICVDADGNAVQNSICVLDNLNVATVVDRLLTGNGGTDSAIRNNAIYQAAFHEGLIVSDLDRAKDYFNNLSNTMIAQLDLCGHHARSITEADEYLFVAAREGGLFVVNTISRTNPVIQAHYEPGIDFLRVESFGDKLYLVGHSSIHVLNIASPTNPRLLGIINTTGLGAINAISIKDGVAAITFKGGAVLLHDVDSGISKDNITLVPTDALPFQAALQNGALYLSRESEIVRMTK